MIGKQFSFFLGPNDQGPFEEAMRASGDIAFLRYFSQSPLPDEVSTSRVVEMGKEVLALSIALRSDLPMIQFTPIRGREEFVCDSMFAPVIEFGRCFVTNSYIRAGRLYRVDRYWDESDQRTTKRATFVDWANNLYKLAKSSLTKVEHGYYAGSEALKLREAGIAFEGLDIGIGSIKDLPSD